MPEGVVPSSSYLNRREAGRGPESSPGNAMWLFYASRATVLRLTEDGMTLEKLVTLHQAVKEGLIPVEPSQIASNPKRYGDKIWARMRERELLLGKKESIAR